MHDCQIHLKYKDVTATITVTGAHTDAYLAKILDALVSEGECQVSGVERDARHDIYTALICQADGIVDLNNTDDQFVFIDCERHDVVAKNSFAVPQAKIDAVLPIIGQYVVQYISSAALD